MRHSSSKPDCHAQVSVSALDLSTCLGATASLHYRCIAHIRSTAQTLFVVPLNWNRPLPVHFVATVFDLAFLVQHHVGHCGDLGCRRRGRRHLRSFPASTRSSGRGAVVGLEVHPLLATTGGAASSSVVLSPRCRVGERLPSGGVHLTFAPLSSCSVEGTSRLEKSVWLQFFFSFLFCFLCASFSGCFRVRGGGLAVWCWYWGEKLSLEFLTCELCLRPHAAGAVSLFISYTGSSFDSFNDAVSNHLSVPRSAWA